VSTGVGLAVGVALGVAGDGVTVGEAVGLADGAGVRDGVEAGVGETGRGVAGGCIVAVRVGRAVADAGGIVLVALAGAEFAGVALDGAAVADGDRLGCSESVAVISPPGVSFGVP
jgi:hypothetical protein